MINIAEIIHDLDFCQPYTLLRKTTVWLSGNPKNTVKSLSRNGVITAATQEDLLQVPEGDRVKGIVAVYDTEPLQITDNTTTSDEIVWHSERYRLFQLWPYKDYGYYKALGVRIVGK